MPDDLNAKLGLDSTDFKGQLIALNREIRVLESGFRSAAAPLGDWANQASGLEKRIDSLNDQMEVQTEKVKRVRAEWERVAAEKGKNDRAAKELEIRLNKETETLGKMESELRQAKNSLDKMGDESVQTGRQMDDLGDKEDKLAKKTGSLKSVMHGLGTGLKAGGLAVAGLTVAVAGAAAAMAKKVVESFGELEQNLGGSEAVFGQYAASIQKAGEDAYKNLGVSQSDYLATANKMGALFQGSGIDQVKSLELTEQAMQRAADMASVMGIDTQVALDSIAGAAKGNFTMMDNLGVAMNATTVEAYALSKGLDFTWASATNAEKAEVAMQMFFENTQQYAGNFAKESSSTITGSIGMLKAAFGSFTAGLGSQDVDMSGLTDNLVDAFKTVVKNVVPVLENIVTALPEVSGSLIAAIADLLPMLLDTATELFNQVLNAVVGLLPELIPVAVKALMTILNAIIKSMPLLLSAGILLVKTLINGILPQLPMLLKVAVELIVMLAQGISKAYPELLPVIAEIIPEIIIALIDSLPLLIDAALELILALVDGLIIALPILIEYIPEIVTAIFNAIILALPKIGEAAVKLVLKLVDGIGANLPKLGKSAGDLVQALVTGVKNLASKLWEVGKAMVTGIWDGLKQKEAWFKDQIKNFFKNIIDGVKKALGIASPSKVFAGIGENMALGLGGGFTSAFRGIEREINNAIGALSAPETNLALAGAGSGYGGRAQPQQLAPVTVNANVASNIDIHRLARAVADEQARQRR